MDYAYIGLIMPFASTFAPQGWLLCQGQTLPIAQYSPLFAVIGTQFGGDGKTNFKLPDLQQRILIGAGGSTQNGATMGTETATLTSEHLPAHSHDFMASDAVATLQAPAGTYLAKTGKTDTDYNKTSTNIAPLAATAIGSTGSTTPAPFSVRQPAVSVNFVICVNGTFPPRP
jgi:microcystin-dependent protein